MEPLSVTAGAIVSLIITQAATTAGESLGEGISQKIAQLTTLIKNKFQTEDVAGILTKAQKQPTEKNQLKLQDELSDQMEADPLFATELTEIVEELQAEPNLKQIFLKQVIVKGTAEIAGINQEATGKGTVTQEAFVDVQVGGDLKIGQVNQRGSLND
ncbi:MAG: hypothetical protein AAGA80_13755 [Cyanobacteria bacterium P01_F01_bin.143]